jgi:plasmid maintenance system antidote protein VapI
MAKSEDLQRQTQRVLAELGAPNKPLSARAAGEKLGIGYNQIADMVKGKSPAEKTLMKFASAIGESQTDWLRYGGKNDFADTLGGKDEAEPSPEQKHAQQIARDLARVPKERRALVMKQIRALIRASEADSSK